MCIFLDYLPKDIYTPFVPFNLHQFSFWFIPLNLHYFYFWTNGAPFSFNFIYTHFKSLLISSTQFILFFHLLPLFTFFLKNTNFFCIKLNRIKRVLHSPLIMLFWICPILRIFYIIWCKFKRKYKINM